MTFYFYFYNTHRHMVKKKLTIQYDNKQVTQFEKNIIYNHPKITGNLILVKYLYHIQKH